MSGPILISEAERATYPAMLPLEIAVWRSWLKLHQSEYDRFDYNTRVGPGTDPGVGVPESTRRWAERSTRLRIDAVLWQGSYPTLVEVKYRAGMSAVGQLLGYAVHWRQENPTGPIPKILLVANQFSSGIGAVLAHHGVTWERVTV